MRREITITLALDASTEHVWNAWTDPVQVAEWWGPDGVTTTVEKYELTPGGAMHMTMHAGEALGELRGQEWPMQGEFQEVVPFQKLIFSNNALNADGAILLTGETTMMIEEQEGKTKLTVITGAEGDAPGTEQMLDGMEPGWNQQLDKLAAFLR